MLLLQAAQEKKEPYIILKYTFPSIYAVFFTWLIISVYAKSFHLLSLFCANVWNKYF